MSKLTAFFVVNNDRMQGHLQTIKAIIQERSQGIPIESLSQDIFRNCEPYKFCHFHQLFVGVTRLCCID